MVAKHILSLCSNEEDFHSLDLRILDLPLHQPAAGMQQQQGIACGLFLNSRVKELHLIGSIVAPTLTIPIITFLQGILVTHPSLQIVFLGQNDLNDDHAVIIAQALKLNTSLRMLWLSANYISDRGGTALAESLKCNMTLEELNLADNDIGPDGGRYLGAALRDNKTLKTLLLSDNRLGNDGAAFLANGLRRNDCLTILHLGGNSIGDDGCIALAAALRTNARLCKLDLIHNSDITDVGVAAFDEVLKDSNYTLEALDLYNWGVTNKRQMSSIRNRCDVNRRIKMVFRRYKSIDVFVIPPRLWPNILATVSSKPELIFTILKSIPDLIVPSNNAQSLPPPPPSPSLLYATETKTYFRAIDQVETNCCVIM